MSKNTLDFYIFIHIERYVLSIVLYIIFNFFSIVGGKINILT